MAEIVYLEQKLEACLMRLKEEFSLCAVKAEFEAEGASFHDLVRLRRLTARHNIPLYLKIGGVEGLRDIKDALILGVDGLIAPMVESPFGVIKFTNAVESVFSGREVFKSINIETRNAIECVDEILYEARGKVDNVTIGRTDLSQSYFDPNIDPDSELIFNLIDVISRKVYSEGLSLTIGGSLTTKSINYLKKNMGDLDGRLSNLETRKIIGPAIIIP